MVHAQVFNEYINYGLMCTIKYISPVLPIKHLLKHNGESNTTQKLATGTKTSVSNLSVFLSMCCMKGN